MRRKRSTLMRVCRRSFGSAELGGRRASKIARAQESDSGALSIQGMSAQFGVWYEVRDWLGTFLERIDGAAFERTLRENAEIVCCYNHDPNYALAAARGGTLKSYTDQVGLHYEAQIDRASPNSMTAYSAVARGDVQGASIAFRVVRDLWEFDRDNDTEKVTILEARLFEHGPVLNPASPTTTAEVQENSEDEPEAIRSVVIKLRRGVELTPFDLGVLNRNSEEISESLQGSEPQPTEPHGDPDAEAAIEAFRSRLGLLSKSVSFHLGASE